MPPALLRPLCPLWSHSSGFHMPEFCDPARPGLPSATEVQPARPRARRRIWRLRKTPTKL